MFARVCARSASGKRTATRVSGAAGPCIAASCVMGGSPAPAAQPARRRALAAALNAFTGVASTEAGEELGRVADAPVGRRLARPGLGLDRAREHVEERLVERPPARRDLLRHLLAIVTRGDHRLDAAQLPLHALEP